MLKHRWWMIAVLVVVILAEWMCWLFSCDPPTPRQSNQGPYYGDCSSFHSATIFLIGTGLRWIGHTLESYHEAVVAIATVIIAYFTYTLWKATDGLKKLGLQQARDMRRSLLIAAKSAKAAAIQADTAKRALTELERPYIFIWDLKGAEVAPLLGSRRPETLYPQATFTYAVSNQGNLAAVIENVQIAYGYERDGLYPPLIQIADHKLIQKRIIASRFDVPELTHSVDMMRLDGAACDGKFKEGLIFRIVVTYRAAFTKGHETSQCWKCTRAAGLSGFYEIEDERYTYMR